MKKVKFKKWNCIVEKKQYHNGRIALVLTEEETGEPVATASVNIEEYDMGASIKEKCTFIKNYSENEGMLDCLVEAEVVRDTGLDWPIGFVSARLVEVLI